MFTKNQYSARLRVDTLFEPGPAVVPGSHTSRRRPKSLYELVLAADTTMHELGLVHIRASNRLVCQHVRNPEEASRCIIVNTVV